MSALLDLLDERCVAVTRRIAFIGVLGMLIIAALTVTDIVLRWLWGASVVGFNEVIAMGLAVAIAATFPAGAAGRVNLTIDILVSHLGRRSVLWLRVLGAFFLLVLYVLLAWHMGDLASDLFERNVRTVFLRWPQAPFIWTVTLLLGATVAAQIVVALVDLRNALAGSETVAASGFADFTANNSETRRQESAFVPDRVLGLSAITALTVTALAVLGLNQIIPVIAADVQSIPGTLAIVLFLVMWLIILMVIPLGAAMALVGVFGSALLMGVEPALSVLASETASFITNPNVAVLPLFLMMGSFAVAAGLSGDIYHLVHTLVSHWRGGLALATIGGCGGFGALTGSSLATTATIGRVALPEMSRRGYSIPLATGCVAAGGTLGALVPPSVPLIFYAILTEESIGQLFIASVVPAMLAISLYFLTIMIYVRVFPTAAPTNVRRASGREIIQAFRNAWEVLLLFGVVVGGLYGGVFTATESAAVGAGGAFMAALLRGKLTGDAFVRVMGETTATTAMIYILIFGALNFSFFMSVTGAPELMTTFFEGIDMAPIVIVFLLLAVYIALGAVMDPYPVMFITVPIVAPLIQGLGFDWCGACDSGRILVWWGVIMVVVLETGLITPPFGINVFVLKSVAGADVPLTTVFRGVMPFVIADFVKLALLVFFPWLALWLPATMIN